MARVVFNAVSKHFGQRASQRLRNLVWPTSEPRQDGTWALRDVSFEAETGETLCLVGANGSGKSTALQLAAGILEPTSGTVAVEGRLAALLELGAGFHPEFTGRENAKLSAALFGLSARETRVRFPEIEELAEIGGFMDRPVKSYSSGMIVRLAFAVAVSVEPEVLLVDEALAVGDYYFRQRCMRRVHALRQRQVTILFVSHSMADVQALGTRALWLDHGRVEAEGEPSAIARQYLARMTERVRDSGVTPAPEPRLSVAAAAVPNTDRRFGDGRARVTGISLLNADGRPADSLLPSRPATVRIEVAARERIATPIVGFMMRNHLGIDFAGTNTMREGVRLEPLESGDVRAVDFHVDMPELYAGSFSFSPAVADGELEQYEICDWIEDALVLPMARGDGEVYGYLHLPCRVEVGDGRTSRVPSVTVDR